MEWQEYIVDILEVMNVEQQVAQTQLGEMSWAIKYIAEAVYHCFMVSRDGSGEEREGTVILKTWETWEAGIGTSEGTKDWGEGPSGLTAGDKGKGKEKEVQEEETLQEE